MADKTGRALGTLDPVIYFKKIDGPIVQAGVLIENHVILPPVPVGEGPGMARKIWDTRYKKQGYEWCEAGTLAEVQKLQQHMMADHA